MTARFGEAVDVDVAADYGALETAVQRCEVEIAWAPPTICARAWPAARAVLKAVREGRTSYRAALVARAADRLMLESLAGLRAAWVDPRSTGGYLLAVSHLRANGIDPARTFAEQRFLGSYRDVLLAVVVGDADVASVFTRTEDSERRARSEIADLVGPAGAVLAPFSVTAESPHDGLVLTRKLDARVAERLSAGLLGLSHTTSAPMLLLEICNAESFVHASPRDYRALQPELLAA
jgi:ABC-type phosphate/phosphonate transport system substrate-binding protein